MPDPKDPKKPNVLTTIKTTFSMAKEMAKAVCTKYLEARFIESCEGKTNFESNRSVWQLTSKGMRILTRFCERNGINRTTHAQEFVGNTGFTHVIELLSSPKNVKQLVILEREVETDKINSDRATIEVIFRRFVGEQPNVKPTVSAADSDNLTEYNTGLVGVRVYKDATVKEQDLAYAFNGKACIDWVLDCCMIVVRKECLEIAKLFESYFLIKMIPNANFNEEDDSRMRPFQDVKSAKYYITEKGMKLAGWIKSPTASIDETMANTKLSAGVAGRDSNHNRMTAIVRDPALRLLFREFLASTHCEENLTFYTEVRSFLNDYSVAKSMIPLRYDLIRENLASAYSKFLLIISNYCYHLLI